MDWAVEALADYVDNVRPRFGLPDHGGAIGGTPCRGAGFCGSAVRGPAACQIAVAAATFQVPALRRMVRMTRFWSTFSPLILAFRRYWLR
jgi:hypothetical protein